MDDQYGALKLSHQLCFPLYACSREIIKRYKPFLDELDLTYTQYIAMMVLWEQGQLTVKELGEALYLDSGTLTPLLKKLEAKGLVSRERSKKDERCLNIQITQKGEELRAKAGDIPNMLSRHVSFNEGEEDALHDMLYRILDSVSPRGPEE